MFRSALRFRFLIALAVAALFASGCSSEQRSGNNLIGLNTKLTLTGSSTVAPAVSDIAKRYEQAHPGARIDVQTGGSSRGIADARNGLADLGMVSRSLKDDESDLRAATIALDGVCIIVHVENPVESLTDEQVVGIYTGKIENWSEVGGSDAPITVVNKAEGRSTLELFANYYKLDPKTIQADIVIGDNEQGIKSVVGSKDAIGYVSIGTAEYNRSSGVPVKLLPVSGIEATTENVANGTFPISRPLNLVTLGEPSPEVADFIRFAQSEEHDDILKDHAVVPPPRKP